LKRELSRASAKLGVSSIPSPGFSTSSFILRRSDPAQTAAHFNGFP
jgi:hypothetical protein